MLLGLPVLSVLLGGFGGQALVRHSGWGPLGALVLALVGAGYLLARAGQAATNFDGITHAIWLFLAVLPCGLGLLIGGPVGHLRRRRARKAATTTPEAP